MKPIYFLSGLPRSGSTVLAGILNQHPSVHASSTSGLLDMLLGTLRAWADSMSVKASPDKVKAEKEIQRILRLICEAKYEQIEKPIVIDKERSWASGVNIPTMFQILGEKPKIIATVRNIPDCVASMVRIAKPDNLAEFLRSSELIKHVKEAYKTLESGYRFAPECILFVDYDDLLNEPQVQLNRVHEFLGLKDHDYDFNAIDGSNLKELDEEVWSVKGLHDIRTTLGRSHNEDARDVLGRHFAKFEQPRFWLNETTEDKPTNILDMQLQASLRGDFEKSYELAKTLEQLQPEDDRAAFNRGWFALREGKLQEGMRLLARGRNEGIFGNGVPRTPTPLWDGQQKGTILLNLEGGIGDQIHGLRYVREIEARGNQVIVACSGEIAGLVKDVTGVSATIQHEAIFGVYHDAWIPSMSALIPLGLEVKDINPASYLDYKKPPKGRKMRIGLRWKGSQEFEHEQHRVFPSALMFDAVKGHDARFISLQRDVAVDERPNWVESIPLEHWGQTRDAIAASDLIITSCTSIAHLSAAMGIPTWIVVPILSYYLWADGKDTSYWYDSVRLFRQTEYGNWDAPFIQIAQQLEERQQRAA